MINALAFNHSTATPLEQQDILQGPKSFQADTSSILNVKVWPVPVSDQINVSYHVNKDANVTIQVTDVLGSRLFTLLSQRVSAGEQRNSFSLASRLNRGLYLIKVIVGSQKPVTKKIFLL